MDRSHLLKAYSSVNQYREDFILLTPYVIFVLKESTGSKLNASQALVTYLMDSSSKVRVRN